MKKSNIVVFSILLILSLLNYDYSKLTNFEYSKSNILDLSIIIICVVAIVFYFKNASEQNQRLSEGHLELISSDLEIQIDALQNRLRQVKNEMELLRSDLISKFRRRNGNLTTTVIGPELKTPIR